MSFRITSLFLRSAKARDIDLPSRILVGTLQEPLPARFIRQWTGSHAHRILRVPLRSAT